MGNQDITITILGGGIRGTAIAALLAQTGQCHVRLVERERIASGATSTNHGRLHIGTSLWRCGPEAIIDRRRRGSELVRRIPGVLGEIHESLHLVESIDHLAPFEAICNQMSIPCTQVHVSSLNRIWVVDEQFAGMYDVPEFAFNPAHLAGRFAAHALSLGADIVIGAAAESLDCDSQGRYRISLSDGRSYTSDLVINALGSWANQVRSELPLPHLDLEWPLSRLLCLDSSGIPGFSTLDRVLTIIDQDNVIPSAIPHDRWVIFGCDLDPVYLPSPDDMTTNIWRAFDIQNEMDQILFEVNLKYFPMLRSLSHRELTEHMFSFAGIYPNLKACKERIFQIHQNPQLPGYYAISGGNATTALLDALDLVERVLCAGDLCDSWTSFQTTLLQEEFLACLTAAISPCDSGMIWEAMSQISREVSSSSV